MKRLKSRASILARTLLILTLSFGIMSCEGPVGPEGPKGDQGEEGPAGPKGDEGPAGEDGNAEVIYSQWIPANFTGSSTSVKYMDIDFPADLPSSYSIKDTHVILVYFTGYGDGNVYMLPVLNFRGAQFTFGFGSLGNINFTPGDIRIRAEALSGDLNEFQIDPARGNEFRYVIIPPNIAAGTSTDFSDYREVVQEFKLNY